MLDRRESFIVSALASFIVVALAVSFTVPVSATPANTTLSTANGQFLRGDANGDRSVDIADPVRTLSFLFAAGTVPCLDAVDAILTMVLSTSPTLSRR